MDPGDTLEGVDPAPRPTYADGKRLRLSSTLADPVSKVLGDDNLLIEIIVRLGYPMTLVRAALVCKRWLGIASDPAILSRFRKLHPPRLLGFYVETMFNRDPSCFVSMLLHPPEFDTVIRRASFSLPPYKKYRTRILDCRNDNVLISLQMYDGSSRYSVHRPLCPKKGMTILPPLPQHRIWNYNSSIVSKLFLKEEGAGLSCMYVLMDCNMKIKKTRAHVYMLQDDVWQMHTSATTEVPCELALKPLLAGNKIYTPASRTVILILDLAGSSFSTIQLPQGVVWGELFNTIHPPGLLCGNKTILSRADDDSGVYLIHVNELQFDIWLHKGDNWLLVDTISLSEMCADLRISDPTLDDEHNSVIRIREVGVNAEFVFFTISRCIFYWDIKGRTVRKVHEMTEGNHCLRRIHPFPMIWPPKFPALKDDHARRQVMIRKAFHQRVSHAVCPC